MFPDKEALKHGLKNAEVMEERNAALNASKLIQEEEQQKKKGGPKINEGKLIQKKKGSSNRGKEKVIEVEKQENLIREEKQKKLIQEEPLEKKGVNSGGKEVKRMDQEDIHNQCEDNVHSSDSTTFTVSSKITLLANSCQGTLESDSNDPVPKSFLTPTNFQADNFNVLHALCSSDINLLNVENMIKDCNKTALLLVTEPVKTLEGFFNNELKKISSSGKVTRKLWWEHIALMFRQIFRDYSRGLLFLFSSSSGFCGDLSFNLYVTNEGKGKILPSLKSKVNQGLRRLQRQDVADWVNQMVKVISLPFKKAVKVNEDELEIPLELKKLLRCEYCIKHKNSPNVSAQFLVDHPFFWTKKERVNFIIKLKALLKIYPSKPFLSTMGDLKAYRGYEEKLFGVYKAIFAKGEFDIEKPSSPGTFRVRKYRGSKDLVRFCGSVYTHCNDGEYKSIRGNKVLSVDNVHDDLRILFPELYADIYNAIGDGEYHRSS